MILQESIDAVKDTIRVEEIIGDYVDLKKSGSGLKAPCPFHEEKSASFHVNAAKGFYKCFGCGEGGDGIKFLMKKENLSYPDAIRASAKKYNIQLKEVAGNEEDSIIMDKKTSLFMLNAGVAKHYQLQLLDILKNQPDHWITAELYGKRNFSDETIIDFKLGYAPEGWNFLTGKFKEAEHMSLAKELGLVAESKGKTYDYFRDRLMFPFIDKLGRVTGFTGRKPSNCTNDDNPKYFNSKESLLFKKSKTFYGIYQADSAIRKEGNAILVEGQTDVCQMHQKGFINAIATSGTSFTEEHAHELKRLTAHAIIITDEDSAGLKSALKTIDILVENGFKTEVVRLPDGEDPDSFIRAEQQKLEEEAMKGNRF